MEIIVQNVAKRFTNRWIIKDFNYHFLASKIYGLSGFNGSGKTTLLTLLAGIIPVSKGSIEYFQDSEKMSESAWFEHLSFAAPYAPVFEYLSLNELLKYHLTFRDFYSDISSKLFIEIVKLESNQDALIQTYSSGMKQRLKLGLALCTKSDVVFLDEPLSNLDEVTKAWYFDLLQRFRKERIIIIASNDKQDFEIADEKISL